MRPKHKGISLLIIDNDTPGITVTPLWTIIGERTNDVFFDNVRVPKERLVGELNEGWRYIGEALTYERFTMASVVPTQRKFGELVEWVKKAEVDGKPLRKDPIIRRKIAHLSVLVEMARMLDLRCVCLAVKPDYVPYIEAMMNKMWGGIVETILGDTALDILAPYGFLWKDQDAPLDGVPVDDYLWAGHQRVAAAGVDIAKNTIARRYLGLPSSLAGEHRHGHGAHRTAATIGGYRAPLHGERVPALRRARAGGHRDRLLARPLAEDGGAGLAGPAVPGAVRRLRPRQRRPRVAEQRRWAARSARAPTSPP